MRSIFLLGGFLGFSLVLIGGWWADREMATVLRDAAIGCLLMAFTFRWFWSVVVRSFRETARAKRAVAEAKAAAEEAAANAPPAPGRIGATPAVPRR